MSQTAAIRREAIRAALAVAFPAATWTIHRQDVDGVFGALTITVAVADLYVLCGCSEVVVYPTRKSATWHRLARAMPKTGHPRSVVAAARRALREVERLRQPVLAALALLGGDRS